MKSKRILMTPLVEINELAKGYTDFHVASFNGYELLIVGSFDLCYYHDLELRFTGVHRINCTTYFDCPEFFDAGPVEDYGRRFVIRADEEEFEIIASTVELTICKVYYYDRGEQLKPGERIADWVKRGATE